MFVGIKCYYKKTVVLDFRRHCSKVRNQTFQKSEFTKPEQGVAAGNNNRLSDSHEPYHKIENRAGSNAWSVPSTNIDQVGSVIGT